MRHGGQEEEQELSGGVGAGGAVGNGQWQSGVAGGAGSAGGAAQAELTGREPRSILQTMLARVAGEAQALQPLLSQVQAAQGEMPEQRRI